MAFWCRIGKSKLKQFSNQFKSFPHGSLLNPIVSQSKACVSENLYSIIHDKPTDFFSNVRFFAAPVQFQAKANKEDKYARGPRLNEKITAQVVRLVINDEHSIVSRHEALEHARKLNLDLVEVQGNADPPVCKIMDFHKEKYQKQLNKKERSKSKPEVTLRSVSKEVRFTKKIEQKDLFMKAELVKRLMEEGYRVKCTACNAKNSTDEDLLGTLSRLSALIEDEAVVESGPLSGKDTAYVMVRHVKFGQPKKGGKKLVASLTPASDDIRGPIEDLNAAESGLEPNNEGFSDEFGQARSSSLASYSKSHSSDSLHSFHDSRQPQTVFSSPAGISDSTENRYRKSGARNQFPNQGRQPARDTKFSQQMRENEEAETNASVFRNYKPPLNDAPRREPFSPSAPGSPRPGYGIFSGSKANAFRKHGAEAKVGENKGENRYPVRSPVMRGGLAANENSPRPNSEGRQPGRDGSRQEGWGVFSRKEP